MILRELAPKDEEAFLHLLDEWDFLFGLMDELGFKKYLEMLHELKTSETPTHGLFAFVDNLIVGKVSLRLFDHPAGHLGYAIAEKYQGKGYGSKMVELALSEARDLGMESLRLVTKDSNLASVRLIEKNGGALMSTSEKNLEYKILLKT